MFNKLVSARNSKKGFTLIELMVVVAIIAILAAVAIPGYMAYKRSAQIGVVRNAINSMIDMVNASQATGQLPITIDANTTLKAIADHYDAVYDHVNLENAKFTTFATQSVGGDTYWTLTADDDALFAIYVA